MAFCVGMAPDVEDPSSFFSDPEIDSDSMASNQTSHHSKTELLEKSWVSQPISTHFNPFQPIEKSELNSTHFNPFMYRILYKAAHVLRIITKMSMAQRCALVRKKWLRTVFLFFGAKKISEMISAAIRKNKHLIPTSTSQHLMSRSSYLSKCLGSRFSPILGCESPVWNSSFSRRD